MFTRLVTIGVVMSLVIGCAKKAKFTGAADDSASTATPKQPVVPSKVNPEGEKANWLNDTRFKKDGGQPSPVPVPHEAPSGAVAQPAAIVPPNPAAPPSGAKPSRPVLRPVAEADMKEIWIFIDNSSGASGRMPLARDVLLALKAAKANSADLVLDGSITLTGAKTREGIWAFETKGITQGGWVTSQSGTEMLSAADLKRRLGH